MGSSGVDDLSFAVVGVGDGNTSWKRVTDAVFEGLRFHVTTHRINWDERRPIGAGLPENAVREADVAIFIGPPAKAYSLLGIGNFRLRLLMLAPNSTWLPDDVLANLEQGAIHGYLAPSRWARDVIRRRREQPVVLFHHGVRMPNPQSTPMAWSRSEPGGGGVFDLVHFSSSFLERKGTAQLVQAWKGIHPGSRKGRSGALNPRATLRLVLDYPVGEFRCEATNIIEAGRGDFDPLKLMAFLRRHHAVVQPSRAEGFGLVPLEARCVGVPAILTACTGHADHASPQSQSEQEGVVIISHGRDEPIDDGPGALAPSVAVEAIQSAVLKAQAGILRLWEGQRLCMHLLRDLWSPEKVAGDFLARLARRDDLLDRLS